MSGRTVDADPVGTDPVGTDPVDAVPTGPGARVSTQRLRWWDLDDVMAVEVPAFGPDAWTREMFLSELAEGRSRRYVVLRPAEDAAGDPDTAALAGYVGVVTHGPDADVQTLAVDPARRGLGLGRLLVDLARSQAREAGARRLGLEVREDNRAALALYTSAGFRPQGRRPGYYAPSTPGGPRTAAVLMQVDL
ncbi:GNAT family N-acetyltransferase [Aquipuribacter sp. MA13-6]|uniref:GNAT family N-acetyltransferase n=1 Tax=unclassified Aquipuribacter TaxID=2635084 RepID=UPI003EEBEC3B